MNFLHAIILGIVEGITEFLPVSSTFHLIFAAKILGLQQTNFEKLFEVVIQSGAILSVLLLYIKTVLEDHELVKKVLVAFIPTAIVGFVLQKIIQDVFFESTPLMLSAFIVVGIIFIVYEFLLANKKVSLSRSLSSFTYIEALIVGGMQAFAVVPGVSRAGAVILAMMFLKFKRSEAARFSFLLAVPTILAAGGLDIIKMRHDLFASAQNIPLLLVGTVVSFVCAYFVVKWLIHYLQTHSLAGFGWYRIVAGILLFIFVR